MVPKKFVPLPDIVPQWSGSSIVEEHEECFPHGATAPAPADPPLIPGMHARTPVLQYTSVVMKERYLRHLRLAPEISRQVLPLAERLSGRPPVIRPDASLPNDVRAMLVHPRTPKQPYEIHYRRGEEPVLEHLIAHEVGHIVRLHQVPEDERLMPAMSQAARERALHEVIGHLAGLASRGMTTEEVATVFNGWYESLCTQLGSFPADLRIEAWIHEQFPGLRAIQQRSLLEEVDRNGPLFERRVVELTPPNIYRPTMIMNAAQAWQVAEFYGRPDLLEPFERRGLAAAGADLARQVLDAPDEGHRSDMEAVNRWAEQLRLTGWFEWQAPNISR